VAFWSSWFAPKCEGCQGKIVGHEPLIFDERRLCETCHGKAVQAEAKRKAEVEARRAAEEEARRKFEEGKQFGVDPRTQR
jgi:DnaJ-class molecular chaperone